MRLLALLALLVPLVLGLDLAALPVREQEIETGQPVQGTLQLDDPKLEEGFPHRVFCWTCSAAGRYLVSLDSFDFNAALRIESAEGEKLFTDNDSGVETNARISFEAEANTTYRILAVGLNLGATGEFELLIQSGERPLPRGDARRKASIEFRARAAERARARGDREDSLDHLSERARLLSGGPDDTEAREAYEEALQLASEDPPVSKAIVHIRGQLAGLNLQRGNPFGAKPHIDAMVKEAERSGRPELLAEAFMHRGLFRFFMGGIPEAREDLLKALQFYESGGDRTGLFNVYSRLAGIENSDGNLSLSLEYSKKSLEVSKGTPGAELGAQLAVGRARMDLGQNLEEAGSHFERASELALQLGRKFDWARAEVHLATLLSKAGQDEEAEKKIKEAMPVFEGTRDGITSRIELLKIHQRSRRWEQAREMEEIILRDARALCEADRRLTPLLAYAMMSVAQSLLDRGELDKGRELARESAKIWAQMGPRAAEERYACQGIVADSYLRAGELLKAQDVATKAHEEFGPLVSNQARARHHVSVGALHQNLGHFDEARRHYEEACEVTAEAGGRRSEEIRCEAEGFLGLLHKTLGDYEAAHRHLTRAHGMAIDLNDPLLLAGSKIDLAELYENLDDTSSAQRLLLEALGFAERSGKLTVHSKALWALGTHCYRQGQYEDALARFEQAIRVDPVVDSAEELSLARAQRRIGQRDRAMQRAREIVGEPDIPPPILMNWLEFLAQLVLEDGNLDEADLLVQRAARTLDYVSSAVSGSEASAVRGISQLASIQQDIVARRLETTEDPAARRRWITLGFERATFWKNRSLLEGMVELRKRGRTQEAMKIARDRREVLAERNARLRSIPEAMKREWSVERVEKIRREVESLEETADRLATRLEEVSAADAALDLPRGVKPGIVRSSVLREGTVLVEYARGQEQLYAYVLTDQGLHFVELGDLESLTESVRDYVRLISDRDKLGTVEEIADAGSDLFESLLKPALARSDSARRLVIVPWALGDLPFEALVVGQTPEPKAFSDLTFVLDRYDVVYGPSSPVLVELAQRPPRAAGKTLVLADPLYPEPAEKTGDEPPAVAMRRSRPLETSLRLLATRDEARTILQAVDGDASATPGDDETPRFPTGRSGTYSSDKIDLFLGEDAASSVLTGDLHPYSRIHLAAHGHVDRRFPGRTGIALTAGTGHSGYVTIQDVLWLDLDADLVVLSACETAIGREQRGEGVQSLARAFLYAGARSVIASVWEVSDEAAQETMSRLYQRMLSEGLAPGDALQSAKRELKSARLAVGPARGLGRPRKNGPDRRRDHGHPFTWAPFIYIGHPR